ncbi:MAG TPA: S26 family signal peptidase [Rhizomicrobium sp.]|jgi:conjugative transfer signal peptidase TraF|nr:S26 family signal peptidase [Rhizomicrobium sp.]
MTSHPATLALALAAVALAAFTAAMKMPTTLIWNASGSVPIGLYVVRPVGGLHLGELVVVTPPGPLARFLAERGYLPMGVPLLKHIVALPGQTVCRAGPTITVDGAAMGVALMRDRRGRSLPAWQGCRVLADGDVLLMNRLSEDSFDGRYFGPLPAASITGRADPLWTEQGR